MSFGTMDHARWRDSRWRDQVGFKTEWVLVCEDTGVPVTAHGQCPIHNGDACLYGSTVLVSALRELERERLQMLGKLQRALDVVEGLLPTHPPAPGDEDVAAALALLADLRPEENDG